MTDILTKLWMNIDNFNYRRIDLVSNISQEDIDILYQSHKKFFTKPTLILFATIAFSKYRSKLWTKLKEYLYKDRVFSNTINKEVEKETNLNFVNSSANYSNVNQANEIKFVYNTPDSDQYSTVKSHTFKRFSKRNRKNEEEVITQTRQEPKFSQEYLGFISAQKNNIHRISGFKSFMKKFGNKNFVYKKGEDFVLNSRLVYLPFVIVLFLSIYELIITYVALYFKYQPVVDEYYNQKYLKI